MKVVRTPQCKLQNYMKIKAENKHQHA